MSNVPNSLEEYWMPFTFNRAFKSQPNLVMAADGKYYTSTDGRQVLDAIAGLWCVNAGHRHPKIAEAITRQLDELDFASSFNVGHPKPFEFAAQLVGMAPAGLDYVFFTNSGSEAVDTALKIALAYHYMRGDGARTRLIGQERAYHGVGFGGISVGGMVKNRMYYGSLLSGVDHLPHTHNLEKNAFSRGEPEWGAHLADGLEDLVALYDASTIAAVIVEPVAGSTGVLVPPKGYLQRLREICDRHGILLIFDEVITGFGRTGASFAAERFDVKPDMMTCAKGMTNGVLPCGGCLVSSEIYDAFMNRLEPGIELFHGYTYSGHPLAAAAGLATLEVYREEGLFERAQEMSAYWEEVVHGLKGLPHVIDIRNIGLVAGVELESRTGAPTKRAIDVFQQCFDRGLLIRTTGDTLAFSPPLIIEREQIDFTFELVADALKIVE
jgi:beta-alanine--pyruvate transaminase